MAEIIVCIVRNAFVVRGTPAAGHLRCIYDGSTPYRSRKDNIDIHFVVVVVVRIMHFFWRGIRPGHGPTSLRADRRHPFTARSLCNEASP
jgi:hypothetical protein